MRDYEKLWKEIKSLSEFEKELFLMDIFSEFKSRELFEVKYCPGEFFEETVPRAINLKNKKIAQ